MPRMPLRLNFRLNPWVFVTLALSSAVFLSQASGEKAEIRGRVTECWEGRHRPVADLRVYVLTMEDSEEIRDIFEKMKQLPHGDSSEATEQYVQKFGKLYDELIAKTKAIGEPKGLSRTDKNGRYVSKDLHIGERYLVLAIDWERASDDIGFYEYLLTDNLRSGITTLNIYMGPGRDSDCG